jgi:DNA polymerase III sliding clamp (beta) subunit (PCNA family)
VGKPAPMKIKHTLLRSMTHRVSPTKAQNEVAGLAELSVEGGQFRIHTTNLEQSAVSSTPLEGELKAVVSYQRLRAAVDSITGEGTALSLGATGLVLKSGRQVHKIPTLDKILPPLPDMADGVPYEGSHAGFVKAIKGVLPGAADLDSQRPALESVSVTVMGAVASDGKRLFVDRTAKSVVGILIPPSTCTLLIRSLDETCTEAKIVSNQTHIVANGVFKEYSLTVAGSLVNLPYPVTPGHIDKFLGTIQTGDKIPYEVESAREAVRAARTVINGFVDNKVTLYAQSGALVIEAGNGTVGEASADLAQIPDGVTVRGPSCVVNPQYLDAALAACGSGDILFPTTTGGLLGITSGDVFVVIAQIRG